MPPAQTAGPPLASLNIFSLVEGSTTPKRAPVWTPSMSRRPHSFPAKVPSAMAKTRRTNLDGGCDAIVTGGITDELTCEAFHFSNIFESFCVLEGYILDCYTCVVPVQALHSCFLDSKNNGWLVLADSTFNHGLAIQ